MQPKIINMDKLIIKGISGNGSKTMEVWNEFDRKFNAAPFPKGDDNGYEIRYFDGEKTAPRHNDIHVGFITDNTEAVDGFTAVTLPAAEYAVFDVYVAKGYDSGNEGMDKWLAENSAKYAHMQIDGVQFIVECYNEKFGDGNQPDSIVEMWIPLVRFCQSCYINRKKK